MLKQKLPKDTPIPSEATVLYSFSPPNMFSKSSQYYTGKINLKHAIQRRLLRSFHADSHYCKALFRYIQEMAIQHKENCLFFSCNDKAKVDYGEPGTPIVTLKDSVFQVSNSFRSILELNQAIINTTESEKLANLRYFF